MNIKVAAFTVSEKSINMRVSKPLASLSFCTGSPEHSLLEFAMSTKTQLTLNAPIATKVVCFSRLLKCLRSLYGKQCGPISDCSSGSMMFASILNSSVRLGNYLQQTTFSDVFFLAL